MEPLSWTEVMGRLMPRLCLLCESACGCAPLCPPCSAFLPGSQRLRCETCARPWNTSARCATCRLAPPAYEATRAAADYCAPLDRALTSLKFSGQIGLASGLGALLADAWLKSVPAVGPMHWIVPVPLSSARLAERGFNQASLIAASMLKSLRGQPGLPALRPSLLTRQRNTLPQSLLTWKARQGNVDHGFVAAPRLDGLCIGVVDDVMTTGATLQAAAVALKSAGAATVVNLVVARTA